MKMSDVFQLPIEVDGNYLIEGGDTVISDNMALLDLNATAHAINMHDELVEALEGMIEYGENITDPAYVDAVQVLSKATGKQVPLQPNVKDKGND